MQRKQHILALDGLRTIAVACVLVTHYADGDSFLRRLGIDWAVVGVHIFFVISGFLITKLLVEKYFQLDTFASGFFAFLTARITRILPLALVSVAFIAFFSPVTSEFLAYTLTFTSNFYTAKTGEWFPYAGHYWSLSVEMQFYVLFPFFVWFFRKNLLRFLGVALVIALLSRVALTYLTDYKNPSLLLPARMDAFLWGGILFCHVKRPSYRRFVNLLLWTGGLAYLGESLLLVLMHASKTTPDMSLGNILFAGLVGVTLDQDSRIAQVFSNRALTHFGRISYGIYLWHPIMWLARSTINEATGGILYLSSVPIWIVLTIMTIVISEISWIVVERPANTVGHRLSSRLLKNVARGRASKDEATV